MQGLNLQAPGLLAHPLPGAAAAQPNDTSPRSPDHHPPGVHPKSTRPLVSSPNKAWSPRRCHQRQRRSSRTADSPSAWMLSTMVHPPERQSQGWTGDIPEGQGMRKHGTLCGGSCGEDGKIYRNSGIRTGATPLSPRPGVWRVTLTPTLDADHQDKS